MADTKVSALTAASVAALANEVPINEAGTSKKLTVQQLADLVGCIKRRLTADHTLSSATATILSDLSISSLPVGTWLLEYFLLAQSSATGTGVAFGLNFTGTAADRHMMLSYPGTGTAANTGVADDVGAITGQLTESNPETAFSTTAANMGNTGFASANVPVLHQVTALLVVTVTGNLEIYHGSEGAVSTTVKAGSLLRATIFP